MTSNNKNEEPDMKRRRTNVDVGIDCHNIQSIGIGSFSNDIAIRFASYLSSRDLVNLSLTCRRFGSKNVDTGSSLMEDTARQIICNATEDERDNLPKLANQTHIELYSELEKYRGPRVFDQLIGKNISYKDGDKSFIKYGGVDTYSDDSNTAICNHVMRSGKHYATFTYVQDGGDCMRVGIIRPIRNWDQKGLDMFDPILDDEIYPQVNELRQELRGERTERWGDSNVHYCGVMSEVKTIWFSDFVNEQCESWDRQGYGFSTGDKLGVLLDLDAGTLTVYKNGRRLEGIMKSGLTGEYCWVATMWTDGDSIRIEKGAVPTD